MISSETGPHPILSHIEPVLAVQDITETISHWQNILGFPAKWTWGDPPVHGGVSWQKIFVQFSLNPKLATASKGNSLWIRVEHIEALYNFHQDKKADIVSPLQLRPWGMTEYIVQEVNGYYLHFSGIAESREKSAALPRTIRIVERRPSIKEFRDLASSVSWAPSKDDLIIEKILTAAIFAVVAEDTESGETIGSALLLGDDASFYYVKDVMVRPAWQNRRIGTAMMQAVTEWLQKNAAESALVALISRETLEPFYQLFGFTKAFSMIRYMQPREKDK
jgi:GNAT superfamily N-acetyltransferase